MLLSVAAVIAVDDRLAAMTLELHRSLVGTGLGA